ncbi:5-methylcytosine restriction system specificity protein McrC [Sphingomonas hankookensis]
MTIIVRERGAALLEHGEWLLVSSDPGFRDLVSRSVLGARPGRAGGWELTARGYVGRVMLGGLEVAVTEKIPGGFQAMAEVVAPRAFKLARASSPIVLGAQPQTILAEMLVTAIRSYLSGYALQQYHEEQATGAYLTGSLDVPGTVALRARGIRHKVAFRRHRMTDNLPLNRIAWRALGEIASGEGAIAVGDELAASARALRTTFGDSADQAAILTRQDVLAEALAEADLTDRHPALFEAAALSLAILQGAAPSDGQDAQGSVPRSWFVNLENLFERAVRASIAEALDGVAEVSGPDKKSPLFHGPPPRLPANPDVIVRTTDRIAVFDAKYKDRDGDPSASDIYQLLAHAAALGADQAALFYPSNGYDAPIHMGQSSTGCEVWVFGLDLAQIRTSMRSALERMAFPIMAAAA